MAYNTVTRYRLDRLGAVIFDLDGVVTRTARIHAAAWKAMFDDLLRGRRTAQGGGFEPFDIEGDYRNYVDGKPRYDGVKSFLASRGIDLPEGSPSDDPEQETVCGVGNRKNQYFLQRLAEDGVEVFDSTVALIRRLKTRGVKVGLISASRNCRAVLKAAQLEDVFDTYVDGLEAARLGLQGKPAPAVFLEAAARLGVEPLRAAIVEDALAGVEAGRRGGFGLVIGIDRGNQAQALVTHGATVVVRDLDELPADGRPWAAVTDLPSALESWSSLEDTINQRDVALFLDYDGTLTPIVQRPEDAVLSDEMRAILREAARVSLVALVSGRDRTTVESFVGLPELAYIGSHGFDIMGPAGSGIHYEVGAEFLPIIERAEADLRARLADVAGCQVERKHFTVAVHYRRVASADWAGVEAVVDQVLAGSPKLRKEGGKMVFELRPDLEWDKGTAELWLLKALGLRHHVPVHIGDDLTDETAFRALAGQGIGIVVAEVARPTVADYRLHNPQEVGLLIRQLVTSQSSAGA